MQFPPFPVRMSPGLGKLYAEVAKEHPLIIPKLKIPRRMLKDDVYGGVTFPSTNRTPTRKEVRSRMATKPVDLFQVQRRHDFAEAILQLVREYGFLKPKRRRTVTKRKGNPAKKAGAAKKPALKQPQARPATPLAHVQEE